MPRSAGWTLLRAKYDDGGFSGGNTDRPALQRLLEDVRASKVDVIVVYKVDRLTRSLADFAKLVELFDAHNVSFVSVTQQFNTTTSMGRLTLNCRLPSSNGRSPPSASATRLPPPAILDRALFDAVRRSGGGTFRSAQSISPRECCGLISKCPGRADRT